ncbi:DUF6266 family protein [Pedobacter caeni]|uniref:Uncharacterized protein n=1 Tax=Pedobacter caeni TaxID=288992 RepID=A0A1M4VCD4_9SPHI|nr:DUF6266 family protein [Pedobacter caeni]SHE66644.1 hypothetical protein SAMN04488522_101861 [Pedobacter caeni]
MAFLEGGPFYHLTGKVGNNVGRRVKNKNVFSMKPGKSSKPATIGQANQRAGFGMIMQHVSLFSGAIALGFKSNKKNLAPGNAALSYNLEHGLKGTAPNYSIDYENFSIGRGKLAPVQKAKVASVAGEMATLDVSWELIVGYGISNNTDLVKIYIHTPEIEHIISNPVATLRSALTLRMVVPFDFIGLPLHCYIMVVTADEKMVSDSKYCGSITLT